MTIGEKIVNALHKAGRPPEEVAKIQAEIEWGGQRPALFLAAWKRGVKLAGEEYFNIEGDIGSATNKDQLAPKYEAIRRNLGAVSSSQGAFLAAMYIFYNASDGQDLLNKIDCPTMHDLSTKLADKEQLEIIAELFINDCGW